MRKLFNRILIAVVALISAMGTVPYGFKFAKLFISSDALSSIFLGIFFAVCASGANAMLGTYSLLELSACRKNNTHHDTLMLVLGILGAIPIGFVCFFGYQNFFSVEINVIFCLVVILVNSAINYTAIKNLQHSFLSPVQAMQVSEVLFRTIGAALGVIVSFTYYLAATHGLTDVLLFLHVPLDLAYRWGCLLAILVWLPAAALFANATQIVVKALYKFVQGFSNEKHKITIYNVIFLIIVLASGSAVTQMIKEFYYPNNYIPELFKSTFIQALLYKFLMPVGFFSSAAVNFFSIIKLLDSIATET